MRNVSNDVTLSFEETLKALGNDSTRLHTIAAMVLQDLPLIEDELQSAVASGDHKVARRMLSAIQGLASDFHAQPLWELATELEENYGTVSEIERKTLLNEIHDACDGTILAIHHAFESIPPAADRL